MILISHRGNIDGPDPKNENKTMEQLKAIVIKNLEKNPTYYTEKGQFGVKDLGYTMDAPGLGEPKEPKGKYKSSGYGNLKEHTMTVGGGIVSGGGFTSMDYKDFFGLNEAEGDPDDAKTTADELERAQAAAEKIADTELFEDAAPVYIEALADAAEAAYEAGMSIDEIMSMIEQHLGLKMGDF